jgi:hypothetical protein
MQIGIGLPNPVPGTTGDIMVQWARRAEEAGLLAGDVGSSLSTASIALSSSTAR